VVTESKTADRMKARILGLWPQHNSDNLDERSRSPFYGVGAVFLLYLLMIPAYEAISFAHKSFAGRNYEGYWYYDPPASLLAVLCLVVYQRPGLLLLSRWRPRLKDVVAGLSLGIFVPWMGMKFHIASSRVFLESFSVPRSAFIPLVLLTPFAEEMFLRGTIQKSLQSRWPRVLAVILVTFLAAIGHVDFWWAVVSEFLACSLYTYLGDSIIASIIAHLSNNMFVYFAVNHFIQKPHA
jgi:membrane protease YdiL (CAAX protease family)